MRRRQRIPPDEWQYGDRSTELVRGTLLRLVYEFVLEARALPSVLRIAMLGSLLTAKERPKDADVLVTIENSLDLSSLAPVARRLMGRAQHINSTADVFLANEQSQYLGRVCSYRECHPRVRCAGTQCRPGSYLKNDLHVIALGRAVVATPPLVLYPQPSWSTDLPADVLDLLVQPLAGEVPLPEARSRGAL